jgi:2,3-bisphosphoglycerate-independent phosphoglycerate mutase
MFNPSEKPGGPCPVLLCILDGWGDRAETEDNAIALADTPNWDRFTATLPRSRLKASADDVGLPDGQMGNSEVGHMNLGAGRVVLQNLPKINAAMADGSLAQSPALVVLINKLRQSGGVCHLFGLLSPGGVHCHQDHMVALARRVSEAGVAVRVHAFLDGRDTPPRAGHGFMLTFLKDIEGLANVSVVVVSGRYYAMDRDQRWQRVSLAYDAIAAAIGEWAADPLAAIDASYANDVGDEFVLPTVIGGYAGMVDCDGLLMANFRADRAREILTALVDPAFDSFSRSVAPNFVAKLGMVEYSNDLNRFFTAIFPSTTLNGILGQVVADAGMKQLRIAETEKYAHVTFFLNGGREQVFEGEQRILVPSPQVATYDLKPEMSALELTGRLVEAIESQQFELIVANYANGDMVGHTGILAAAIDAATTLDACLGHLEAAVASSGGVMLVTADHGNCEEMRNANTGEPLTQHTMNPVPIIMVNPPDWVETLKEGRLSDVAPTLLHLLGLPQPAEMTGCSLIGGRSVQTPATQ